MRELALVGAGRVGRAFNKFWNDRDMVIVDPHVSMTDFLGQAVIDNIDFGIAKTAVIATPGAIAPRKIIQCLEAGMNVVDISFHDGDNEMLGKIAEENGCWYVPDAGFGPGILNAMAARVGVDCHGVHTINAYVGGVPTIQEAPWYYKGTWNTADHLSEYTRPARYIEKGKVKTVMPLESDIRILQTSIGNLEGFCSDGLRTLLNDPIAPNMAEFTLRWPGFIKNMQLMYKSGMLRHDTIDAFAHGIEQSGVWQFGDDEQDISILFVEGRNNYKKFGMRMVHRRHPHFDHSSMSWCTAVGAAAVLHIATYHEISPGLHVIERLVENDTIYEDYNKMLDQGGLKIDEY